MVAAASDVFWWVAAAIGCGMIAVTALTLAVVIVALARTASPLAAFLLFCFACILAVAVFG